MHPGPGRPSPPPASRAAPSAASGSPAASRCWSRRPHRRRAARAGAGRASPGSSISEKLHSPAWSTAARRGARRRRRARNGPGGLWTGSRDRSARVHRSPLRMPVAARTVRSDFASDASTHHAPPHTYTVCRPVARASCNQLSDVKGFPAPTFVLDLGVPELEAFVQALAGVVELGAVDVLQALGVDQHLDPVALEFHVLGARLVGELELVREAGAARGAHAHAQAQALAALGERALHVLGGIGGERDRHYAASFFCTLCFFL